MEIVLGIIVIGILWIFLTGKNRRASKLKEEIYALVRSGRESAILQDVFFEAALKFALESGAKLERGEKAYDATSIQFQMNVDGTNYFIYFAKERNGSTFLGITDADEARRQHKARINKNIKEANPKPENPSKQNIAEKKTVRAEAKEYTSGIGIKFTLIPAGIFQRDDRQKVTISKPFYLGVYPVTQEQWEAVMGSNPSVLKDCSSPVTNVSWNDVQEFIGRLNTKEKHNRYRLPTEMEWELAARAGTDTQYFFGDSEILLGNYAWFDKNSGKTMHPVGQKTPNPYGLYDIYGNVWEWVQDWCEDLPKGDVRDYHGPASGTDRVLRGGCWCHSAKDCRSGERDGIAPTRRSDFLGFRLALSTESNADADIAETSKAQCKKKPKQKPVPKTALLDDELRLTEVCSEGMEQKEAEEQFRLGVIYFQGLKAEQDYKKAFELWSKAAAQGHVEAQYELAVMYSSGDVVRHNFQKATELYELSARKGFAKSQYALGFMYFAGQGLPRDHKKAKEWWEKGAEQGHASSQLNLGALYAMGDAVPLDYEKAFKLYSKAADQGNVNAQANIGGMYAGGIGVEQNFQKGVEWLTKAADQGHANAQYELSRMYVRGEGVSHDFNKAATLLLKAMKQGHEGAKNGLNVMLADGLITLPSLLLLDEDVPDSLMQ